MEELETPQAYHLVEGITTGIIKGVEIHGAGGFTFINLDLYVTLDDGRKIIGRFAFPDADAAESAAQGLVEAAAGWRKEI